jgi:hypothetical protein
MMDVEVLEATGEKKIHAIYLFAMLTRQHRSYAMHQHKCAFAVGRAMMCAEPGPPG